MQVTAILEPHKTLYSFFICLLITAVFSACSDLSQQQTEKVNKALKDSLTSTTESWDVNMQIIEDGVKKIQLFGSYAATYTSKKKNETRIKGPVTIHVFDTTGTIINRVYSDRAVYQSEKAIFQFYGNVRVNTSDNRHLKSEFLKWQQDKNMISTPKFVIVTTPKDSIAGTGFEGDTDLINYTIKKPKGRVIFD